MAFFSLVSFLLAAGISVGAGMIGYWQARKFVTSKLRFVDAVHGLGAPVIAGLVAALVAAPFTLLPFIGAGTALLFGASVALGVRAGAQEIRGRLSSGD